MAIIVMSEKLPKKRGRLCAVMSHGGNIFCHEPKGGELSLKPLTYGEILKLKAS